MIRVLIGDAVFERTSDVRVFDPYTFSLAALREELETPSLFGDSKQVMLLHLLGEDIHDELLAFLASYTGDGTIILREQNLSTKDTKKLQEIGAHIEGVYVKEVAREFNVWNLTDALLNRDKKTAWLLYREAIEQGSAPEELGGILWWQLKSIMLVIREGNPKGVKPFVINKIKRSLQKYSPAEIESLAQQLLVAVHEPRKGNGSAEMQLEQFLLSL